MDENIARVAMAAVIGGTILISMVAMAVAQVLGRRRQPSLEDETAARIEARLARMEQAIDAMAVEVERVSEGQRFTSRLIAGQAVERERA
jgi:hypothetical protein